MPSWFKGGRGKESNDNGTETYTGGIAPVTISMFDTQEPATEVQSKRSWKERKPMSMFGSPTGEKASQEKPSKKSNGNGNVVAAGTPTSDLDMCCIQDGALGCLGFDKVVLPFSGNDGEHYQQVDNDSQRSGRSVRSFFSKGNKVDDEGKQNDETTKEETKALNKIRNKGPIRDRKESNNLSNYLFFLCLPKEPEKEEKKSMSKQRFRIVLVMLCLFFLAMIAGIVAFAIQRQKTRRGKQQINGFADILPITPSSEIDTEGTPQNLAMQWLAFEDPLSPTMVNEEEIQERFAAATLYFATNGPESWKTSLGFLGATSICDWNNVEAEGSIGIFCQDGRVNEINIVNHNLSGSLPNELNYFTEMVVLNLFFNDLTGPIPDLSALIKLEQLDLDDNSLSGSIPSSIFNLPSLANLFLLFNEGLTGTIPEIRDSSKLVAVSLLGCSVSGTLPNSLGKLSSLRLLQLKGNNIGGTIPKNLFSSPSLETLGLDGNRLSGSIPPVILSENGSALTSLSLGSNNLGGSLPYGLDDLSNLKYFYVDDNNLTGSIRNTILGLSNLEQLWLQKNSFSGDISFFLVESKVLADVYLSENDFSGDLQDFLEFAPPSLERVDVSGNRKIEGYISAEIGNFASLKYFNVSACSLGWEIPTDIGRLRKLETLDLSWNDFQGDVPEEMANMQALTTFDISRNRDLGGDLSSSLCKERNDLVFALADCAGSVRVECDCCTHCCNREGVCGPNDNN